MSGKSGRSMTGTLDFPYFKESGDSRSCRGMAIFASCLSSFLELTPLHNDDDNKKKLEKIKEKIFSF